MDGPSSDSGKRPRALFLSPESPYPMVGGGPLRSASILAYLAERYAVHAIVFHQESDPDPARVFPAGMVDRLDVVELPHHSKRPAARAMRNAVRLVRRRPPLFDRFSGFEEAIGKLAAGGEYDAAVIEHFWCAPYCSELRAVSKRVILDLHNVESAWHRSLAECEGGMRAVALREFAAASEKLERRWLPEFDHLLVTSTDDEKLVRRAAGEKRITVYPNALPERPREEREEREEIIFSGNLEYEPNIIAVRFFYEQIWPSLRSRWGNLKWRIAGKHAEAMRGMMGDDPRIEASGIADDAVTILAGAKVAVVPVLAGSGTRIKILEAWAAGTAVVSTTVGAAGLDCRDGKHIMLADDPGSFTECVSELLESSEKRRELGAAGRKFYEERFTWPVVWRRLDSIFGNDVSRAYV